MEFPRVHHVSINVTDAAESIRFYTEVLGLTMLDNRPDLPFAGAWLQAGEQEIHLLEIDGFEPPKGQHFALQVDDLDGARTELGERGVQVSEPAEMAGVCRQAFFNDPTGNLIELNQRL